MYVENSISILWEFNPELVEKNLNINDRVIAKYSIQVIKAQLSWDYTLIILHFVIEWSPSSRKIILSSTLGKQDRHASSSTKNAHL